MSFLTAGEIEVRAWTIPIGTKAPRAAREIHSDIERGFIRAEIVKYEDMRCSWFANRRTRQRRRTPRRQRLHHAGRRYR